MSVGFLMHVSIDIGNKSDKGRFFKGGPLTEVFGNI